ncbi:MAG: hypothetical protein AABW89_02990 [Nanoarchaeota archaeon]
MKNIKEKRDGEQQCDKCGLSYNNKIKANKCQEWCKKHKSCNLEITKHAINKKEVLR